MHKICFAIMTQRLINKLSAYFSVQPIERAWIFGSFARSEQNKKSDIDILVDFSNNETITLFKYVDLVNDLKKITRRKVDLVENGQLKSFAQESAEKDKILIYERKTKGFLLSNKRRDYMGNHRK